MDWEDILFRDVAMAHQREFAAQLDPLDASALRLACRGGRAAAEFIVHGGELASRGGNTRRLRQMWTPRVSDALRAWPVGVVEKLVDVDPDKTRVFIGLAAETVSDHNELGALIRRVVQREKEADNMYISLQARRLAPGADIRNLRAATDAGVHLQPPLLAMIARWEDPTPEEITALATHRASGCPTPGPNGSHIWAAMSEAMDAGNVDRAIMLRDAVGLVTRQYLYQLVPLDSRLAGRVFPVDLGTSRVEALDKLIVSAGMCRGPEELRRVLALLGDFGRQISVDVFVRIASGGNMQCAEIAAGRVRGHVQFSDPFSDPYCTVCYSSSEEVAVFALEKLVELSPEYDNPARICEALTTALDRGNFRAALWLVRRFPDAVPAAAVLCAKVTETSGEDAAAHLRELLQDRPLNMKSVGTMVRSRAPEANVLACTEVMLDLGATHKAKHILVALHQGFPAVARALAARADAARQNRASDALEMLAGERNGCDQNIRLAPRDIALLVDLAEA